MFNITTSDQAENDLKDIHDYIARDNSTKASEFIDYIENKISKLAIFPHLGVPEQPKDPRLPNSQKYVIEDYIAHYTIYEEENLIIITRISHGTKQVYRLI